jgi:hypothetical protein
MKKTAIVLVMMTTLAAAPAATRAQDGAQDSANPKTAANTPEHFYKLNLTVEEINEAGKADNTRTFVTMVKTAPGFTQSVRTGDRVPVQTGSGSSALPQTQFTYIDMGVNIDIAQLKDEGNQLSFRLTANVSSFAKSESIGGINEPVIRQKKWDSAVVVPVGKPTVVFSADDLEDKGKMQVEVTATRID